MEPLNMEERAVRAISSESDPRIKEILTQLRSKNTNAPVVYAEMKRLNRELGVPPTLEQLGAATGLFHTGVGRYYIPMLEGVGLITVARGAGGRAAHRGWHINPPEKVEEAAAQFEELPVPEPAKTDKFPLEDYLGPTVFLVEGGNIKEIK